MVTNFFQPYTLKMWPSSQRCTQLEPMYGFGFSFPWNKSSMTPEIKKLRGEIMSASAISYTYEYDGTENAQQFIEHLLNIHKMKLRDVCRKKETDDECEKLKSLRKEKLVTQINKNEELLKKSVTEFMQELKRQCTLTVHADIIRTHKYDVIGMCMHVAVIGEKYSETRFVFSVMNDDEKVYILKGGRFIQLNQ